MYHIKTCYAINIITFSISIIEIEIHRKNIMFLFSTKGWKSPAFLEEKFSVFRKRKTGLMNQTPTLEIASPAFAWGRLASLQ
jgi:hypothetical protein